MSLKEANRSLAIVGLTGENFVKCIS